MFRECQNHFDVWWVDLYVITTLMFGEINSLRPSDAYICVSKLTIIGSDNGLSPGRRQAIIWTNAGIWLIGVLGTNVSEILIKICAFLLKKKLLKMSGKRRPSCLGLDVLNYLVCEKIASKHPWCIKTLYQKYFVIWRVSVKVALLYGDHYNDVILRVDGISNHQPHQCLLNRLFRHRSKETS